MVAIVLALQRLRACRIERPASSWPRRLAPAAPELRLGAHDYDRDAGKPVCAWDDAQARDVLVDGLVGDPKTVLAAVEASMRAPGGSPRSTCVVCLTSALLAPRQDLDFRGFGVGSADT